MLKILAYNCSSRDDFFYFNSAQTKKFFYFNNSFAVCGNKKKAKPLHSHTSSTENTLDVSLSFVAFYKYNEIISVSGLLYGCTSCKCTQCTHTHTLNGTLCERYDSCEAVTALWQMHARSKENFAFIIVCSC